MSLALAWCSRAFLISASFLLYASGLTRESSSGVAIPRRRTRSITGVRWGPSRTVRDVDLWPMTRFPGTKEVVQASLALTKLTGVTFSTAEGVPVEEFDKLTADL